GSTLAMIPATSPLLPIVELPRATSCVLVAGGAGDDELSSRPKAKNAPDATSAPQRPPTSAPTRNWRRRFPRPGGGAGGPGGVGQGGVVGGCSGHAGGGEGGTVKTSAGGTASSGISLSPSGGSQRHRHLKRRPIRRRFQDQLSCCSHLRPHMIPPIAGNRNVPGAV